MDGINGCSNCANFWQCHCSWMAWPVFCDLRGQRPDGFGKQVEDAMAKRALVPPPTFERASVHDTVETGIELSQ
eukprot:1305132-Pyramimonas_sp.AAC.1